MYPSSLGSSELHLPQQASAACLHLSYLVLGVLQALAYFRVWIPGLTEDGGMGGLGGFDALCLFGAASVLHSPSLGGCCGVVPYVCPPVLCSSWVLSVACLLPSLPLTVYFQVTHSHTPSEHKNTYFYLCLPTCTNTHTPHSHVNALTHFDSHSNKSCYYVTCLR